MLILHKPIEKFPKLNINIFFHKIMFSFVFIYKKKILKISI